MNEAKQNNKKMKSCFKISVALFALFALSTACSEDLKEEAIKGAAGAIEAGSTTFILSIDNGSGDSQYDTDSRLAISDMSASFETGDAIAITSGEVVNLKYNVVVGDDGTVYAVPEDEELASCFLIGDPVYSYYPYVEDADESAIFYFDAEQVQSDENGSHLAAYDVLVATPGVVESSNSLKFKHAVSWLELSVVNDGDETDYLESFTVTAENSIFVTKGELNVCADADDDDYMVITPLETTNEITISVPEGTRSWNKAEPNKSVALRIAIAPIKGAHAYLHLYAEMASKKKIDKGCPGVNFEPGKLYRITANEPYYEREPVGDLEFYIPGDLSDNDFHDDASEWSYHRCVESEHFILFWESEFGDDPTNAPRKNGTSMSFNPTSILNYAEEIFDANVNTLGFVDPDGPSYTDQYKMMIFVNYAKGEDFLATGSGYDNRIGALWANVDGCTDETMAHEIGHCFQYQTYCDARISGSNNSRTCGWRYGFGATPGSGDDDGCSWWEMCAQWQCFQVYPSGMWSSWYYYFPMYVHEHPLHEDGCYTNYFLQDYWIMKHGDDFLGRLWRLAEKPEDPFEVYMRLNDVSLEEFNAEMFDYACRLQTYDLTHCINNGASSHVNAFGSYVTSSNLTSTNGYYQVPTTYAPENFGFNAIRLAAPTSQTTMSVDLVGVAGTGNFRKPSDSSSALWSLDAAGWRFGFVAYNGTTRYYSDMGIATGASGEGSVSFTCPANCTYVWLVVMGAPQEYWHHAWNDDSSDDEQWPYKFKLTNASLYSSSSSGGGGGSSGTPGGH